MESPLVAAQRAAIQGARGRYERGEISVERLKSALDAIADARDVDAVEAVMAELGDAPHRALAAFDPPPALGQAQALTGGGPHAVGRITAIMSAARRTTRAWTLAAHSQVTAVMGEVRLDLRQARLPQRGVMRVRCVMGDVRILIPEGVRVSVRARAILGEANVLGEYVGGIVAGGEADHEPVSGEPVADLEIDVTSIMGTVKALVVRPASASTAGIADLARDTLRVALETVRERLKQGSSARVIEPTRAVETTQPRPTE